MGFKENSANTVEDNMLPAKLAFFENLVENVTPFLTEFQLDAPLAPFLYTSLAQMVRKVMDRIVKKDILDEKNLCDIDVMVGDNLLTSKVIDIGFETEKALSICKDKT